MNNQTPTHAAVSKRLKIGAGILLAVMALGAVFFVFKVTQPKETLAVDGYPSGLEALVFKTVDTKTHGVWDKRLSLEKVDDTQTAAKGKWHANDAWTWIAWLEADGNWKVLVNLDGFDCVELDDVPEEHADFFRDVTHLPDGKTFCYDHSQ